MRRRKLIMSLWKLFKDKKTLMFNTNSTELSVEFFIFFFGKICFLKLTPSHA